MSDFNPGFYGLRIHRPTSGSGVGGTTPPADVSEEAVMDAGRWETVTNGDPDDPECVYEDGDIVVDWVPGP